MKPVSAVALVAVVVIAALAVLGFVLTSRSVNSQDQALLNNDTTQAGVYVSSIFSGVSSDLAEVATGVTATGGSPRGFANQARSYVSGPVAIALLRHTDGGWMVAASVGQGLRPGQLLSARVSSAMSGAGTKLDPVLASAAHGITTLGFAKGAPLVPAGLAVYEQLSIPTYLHLDKNKDAPFHELNAAVYSGPKATSADLVLVDAPSLPLAGAQSQTRFTLGSAQWLLVATAKSPLAGGFPNDAPYVLLGVGLLLALVMGLVVDILLRRQRYAAELVAERTAELVASQEALVLGERLAAVGEMATVVGHELRNPLGAVTNAHYLLRHNLGNPMAIERYLAMAERELARASHLAEDLTAYMRDRPPVPVPVNLKELVREVLEASPPPARVVISDETDGLTVTADRSQVGQILTNLINNAYQAMHDQGSLRLGAAADNGDVLITVQDSGEGMDPAHAAKVFEPFFTTRAEGTGLGLAIVHRLAEGHGGSVSIANAPEGGAVVTVRLPAGPPAQKVSS